MNDQLKTTRPALAAPWVYFVATFIWSGIFGGLAILLDLSVESAGGLVLYILAGAGPMAAGITFTYLTRDKAGRRDYWKRVFSFKRIPAVWYLVIFLFPPILSCLAALSDWLTGGAGATWGESAINFLSDPATVLLSFLFATLIPFIEELGWRICARPIAREEHRIGFKPDPGGGVVGLACAHLLYQGYISGQPGDRNS